jgi:hypothetical protein
VVGLIVALQALGCEPVKHGTFLGVRHAGRMTPALWAELDRQRPALLRHLKSEETPYRRRRRGGSPAGGKGV